MTQYKHQNMKRTYELGIDSNQITLGVTVGTAGTAYTSASIARSGGQQKKIAESNADSGTISDRNIGKASDLVGSYLIIRTIIDFSNIDKSLWKNQADHLIIRYHLDGGFSGNQVYNQDIDDINASPDGKIIIITKPIELK
jgi:hypothetical protein